MSSWQKFFSYETFVHGIGGSVASCFAMFIFYPLDTAGCRLQMENDFDTKNTFSFINNLIKKEGCKSLYQDLNPILISLCASGFVYFYTFHGLRLVFSNNKIEKYSPIKDFYLSSIAGIINIVLTTPLWLITTELKMQKQNYITNNYSGIIDGIIKLSKQEGLISLWINKMPSFLLVTNPAIQFMSYEFLKKSMLTILKKDNLPGYIIFILGATAKLISTLITYPIQYIHFQMMLNKLNSKSLNIIQEILLNYKLNGFNGLYKGLEKKLLQTILTSALMYFCYEKLIKFIFKIMINYKKTHLN